MEAIFEVGGTLEFVVSLTDNLEVRKSGRACIDEFCDKNDIRVLKVDHVNDETAVNAFSKLDWLFIVAWSNIASPAVINAPRMGVLGMHPSLLPEGRGHATIPWAILKMLPKSGVTLFKLDKGVDTGPLVARREFELTPEITATQLYALVNEAHVSLMKDVYPRLVAGTVVFEEQDHSLATFWPCRRPEDGEIDLEGSVKDAERLIRAVSRPYPGAFYYDESGRKVIVWAGRMTHEKPDGDFISFKDGYISPLEAEFVPEG